MKFRSIITFFFLALFTLNATAQSKTFKNIKRVSRSAVKAIEHDNKVMGYYILFFLEKKDRKNFTYRLEILDANMKTTHKIDFTKHRRTFLLEGAFNGTHFCFSFIDKKEKSIVNDIYDLNGKKTGTYVVKDFDKSRIGSMEELATSEKAYYTGTLKEVGDIGFAVNYTQKKSGIKAKVDIFDNQGKKMWRGETKKKKKSFEMIDVLYTSNKYFVNSYILRHAKATKKMTQLLVISDAKTGKKIGRVKLSGKNYFIVVSGLDFDEKTETFYLYGEKVGAKEGSPVFKDKKGILIRTFNAQGEDIVNHVTSWAKVRKKFSSKERAKFEKDVSYLIHEFIHTKDGKHIAIVEQFNKEASALGIASKILNGRNSNISTAKVVLYNMAAFQFDNNFELEKVKLIEKKKRNILLPSGMMFASEGMLGKMIKTTGSYDYNYTSVNSDHSNFNAAYASYLFKLKKKNRKVDVGVIVLDDNGELDVVKMEFSSGFYYFKTLPAKTGYIAIFDFRRKKKEATLRLEKIDY